MTKTIADKLEEIRDLERLVLHKLQEAISSKSVVEISLENGWIFDDNRKVTFTGKKTEGYNRFVALVDRIYGTEFWAKDPVRTEGESGMIVVPYKAIENVTLVEPHKPQ